MDCGYKEKRGIPGGPNRGRVRISKKQRGICKVSPAEEGWPPRTRHKKNLWSTLSVPPSTLFYADTYVPITMSLSTVIENILIHLHFRNMLVCPLKKFKLMEVYWDRYINKYSKSKRWLNIVGGFVELCSK